MITEKIHNKINITDSASIEKRINTSESVRLGAFLAAAGGFLDAYTFISRGGVFANAETGNIVLVGIGLATGNIHQAFMAFLPILSFMIGVFVSSKIKSYEAPSIAFVSGYEKVILILEILVLIIVGFIPSTVADIFVTTTISFVSSVQICTFRKLVDSPYSTTMCTGNLRSACQAAFLAFSKKDNVQAVKSIRYFTIIISFLIGSAVGGFLTIAAGVRSIWFAALILICAVCLFTYDEIKFSQLSQ